MAIQNRRGDYNDYKPARMLAGELAVTLQNDPKAVDGKALHVAFAPGSEKTLMTFEDAEGMIEDATEQATAEAISGATSRAETAATTATNQATASKSYAVGGTSSRSGEDTDNSKYYKEQAASSASSASSSSSSASSSATTATTQATLSKSYAVGGTGSRSGENTDNAKYYKEQAEAAAAQLDTEKILGDFAHYESTTTASKAYAVGDYLTYNGYLYQVTKAIAQGGTIVIDGGNANVTQTTVSAELGELNSKTDTVNVSVGPGTSATHELVFQKRYYRVLLLGHNTVTDLNGIYLLPSVGGVFALVPASKLTVTRSGNNVSVQNIAPAGSANGIII